MAASVNKHVVSLNPEDQRLIASERRQNGENNPLKALRARCLDCCCGSASEVRKCTAVACPSWPFRMGSNPFRQWLLSDEQKQTMAERLAKARAA